MSHRVQQAPRHAALERLGVTSALTYLALVLFCPPTSAENRARSFDRAGVTPDTHGAIGAVRLHYDPNVDAELRGFYLDLVGDAVQAVPWCHVDMYMTPIGEDAVLVADVARGHELAGDLSEYGGFGDLECDNQVSGLLTPDYVQEQLDGVARLLARRGYIVHRVPAVVDPLGDWMITYNNVLMEQRNGRRIVYLPVYRVPRLDFEGISTYSRLGFEVRPIGVSKVYRWGGALRCMVNVTERRATTASNMPPTRHRGSVAYYDLVDPYAWGCVDELVAPTTR